MNTQTIYLIWENKNDEIFVNVCWTLSAAKDWLLWAVETYPENTYYLTKHYRSNIDDFGWREWKKIATLDKNGSLKLTKV